MNLGLFVGHRPYFSLSCKDKHKLVFLLVKLSQ